MSNLHFPDEIIHEILLRLPVKSLLRFRCVCNPWRNLISSPKFAKLHLKQTSEHNADIDHHSVLIASSSRFMTMIFNNLSEESSYHYNDHKLQCPKWFDTPYHPQILGCCNGLIFLHVTFEEVAIWNPSTRDYKVLPKPGFKLNWIRFCGFRFDASIDDYKAVVSAYNFPATTFNVQVEIFTLKTNTWRKALRIDDDDSDEFLHCSGPGNFSNGALHWLKKHDLTIISFDFAQERLGKFVSLPDSGVLPDALTNFKINYTELGVLQGCLCLYIPEFDFMRDGVWVMKEYGVNSSWSKVLSINISYASSVGHWGFIKPLCIFKSGEVLLLANARKLLTYSPMDNNFKPICDRGLWVRAIVYVESLVSLH